MRLDPMSDEAAPPPNATAAPRARRFGLFNHLINPIVRTVLRSPAHRLLSHRLLLLTYCGRVTGRTHTIPLGYERSDDRLTVPIGRAPGKRWWRNVRGGADVTVRLAGVDHPAHADAIIDASGAVSVVIELG
jgi:hypothetical protein